MALNVGIFLSMVRAPDPSRPDTIVRWGGSIGVANRQRRVVAAGNGHVRSRRVFPGDGERYWTGADWPDHGTILRTLRRSQRICWSLGYSSPSWTAAASNHGNSRRDCKRVRRLRDVCRDAGHRHRLPLPIQRSFNDAAETRSVGSGVSLYSVAAGHAGALELSGLAVGLAYGFLLAKPAVVETPSLRGPASLTAAIAVIVVTAGIPMRGVIDVRPEISRITEIEERTASVYDSAVRRFTIGELSLKELVAVIDQTILPEFRSAQDRLKRLQHVPREQAPLVARADEYFKLREESWQARAAGLRRTSLKGLRSPDDTERQAREVLDDLRVQNP